ncbi:hypothetical protein [Nocardioides zeae]
MNTPPDHPGVGPLPDSTSERLYTTDELEAYAAQQDQARAAAPAAPGAAAAPGWAADDTRVVPPVPAAPAVPTPAGGRRRADVPLPAQPAAYGALPPRPDGGSAPAPQQADVSAPAGVPRFMTATDFLDRRVGRSRSAPRRGAGAVGSTGGAAGR